MDDTVTAILFFILALFAFNPVVTLLYGIWEFFYKLLLRDTIDLKKKYGNWAVVTGATDGIGKAYAKELAKKDLDIVLISRSLDKLIKTQNEIEAINPSIKVQVIQADFSKGLEEYAKISSQLQDIPVGILVNNVGRFIEYPTYLGEIPENDIWDMINVNSSSTVLMTRMVIEQMKKRGKGAIVNVSSSLDITPSPLMQVYSASKIFVTFFSHAIRTEYERYGLTVQCLSPFYIRTKMVESITRRFDNHHIIAPDATTYAKHAIRTLGRLNSTTGYYMHDILRLGILICPVFLRSKISYLINNFGRNEYLNKNKR